MTTALPCAHQHKKLVNALWCGDCGAYNELDGNNWKLPSGRGVEEYPDVKLPKKARKLAKVFESDKYKSSKFELNNHDVTQFLTGWGVNQAKQLSDALCEQFIKPPSGKTLLSVDRAVEALQALYDVQNGSPLIKYEAEWNEAMKLASDVLGEFNAQKGA